MPGKRITKIQVTLYMNSRKSGNSQKLAAAKSGFSERSARNIEKRGFQPAKQERDWKTRQDPFEPVWDSMLIPLLKTNPRIQAKTLLEFLQEKFPESYPDSQLRTLQRRIKRWRAFFGPEKEVIFRQIHHPGEQGLSDFTTTDKLQITIAQEPFNHLLYHYRLAYSGWEYAQVVLGGESFPALTESLQAALAASGGSPKTHRTDSLSAAFKNLSKKAREDLTQGYEEFCAHYEMEPTRNNKGVSHENGSIESSHGHLKSGLKQALMIRGSRNFADLDEYRSFVKGVISRRNKRIHKKYLEELPHLRELPESKAVSYEEYTARVTSTSTILVKGVRYSVESRLIGERLKIHVYDDRLECHVAGKRVLTLPRRRKNKSYVSEINYRHVIEALVRKPGAFVNYVHRESFFPTLAYRQTWEALKKQHGERLASKEYLAILKEAAKGDNETTISEFLEECLQGGIPSAKEVRDLVAPSSAPLPHVEIACGSLKSYESLIRRCV